MPLLPFSDHSRLAPGSSVGAFCFAVLLIFGYVIAEVMSY